MGCNYQAPVCVPGNPVGSMGGTPARLLCGSGAGREAAAILRASTLLQLTLFGLWKWAMPGVVAALMLRRHLEFL